MGWWEMWLFSINISLSLYRFMYMLLYQKVYLMWFCRLVCICQYSLQKGQRYLNTFYQESRQHTFPLHTCPKYTLLISFSLALALVYLFLSLSLHLFTSFNSGSHISQVGLELALLPRMVLNFWFSCFHITSAGVTSLQHHAPMRIESRTSCRADKHSTNRVESPAPCCLLCAMKWVLLND